MFRIGANRELPIIMAIDDDMVSREVVATLLTLNGYTVHTAIDGEDALQQLGSGECVPQVILMDAQLPGLRGTELIEQIRHRTRAFLYAVSGSKPSQELLAAADGFLMKPFDVTALKKLLEGHIPQSSMPTPDHSEAVLNPKTLAQFRQLMPEPMVREVYTAVTADLRKRQISLAEAIARGDTAEIRRIGHAIKGGCGMAGALQAARLGAMLEAESDQLYNSEKVLRDLLTATQNLERMLDTEFPA